LRAIHNAGELIIINQQLKEIYWAE